MVAPTPTCGSCGKTFRAGEEARDQHCEATGHKRLLDKMPVTAPSCGDYFCCGSCSRTFQSGWDARDQHCAASGHGKPPNECERCSLWFQTQAGVDEHMAAANHWPYVCHYCQHSCQTEDQCEAHEVEAHTGGHLVAKAGDLQQVKSKEQRSGNGQSLTSVRRVQFVDWLPSQRLGAVPSTGANGIPASFHQPPKKVQCRQCDREYPNTTTLLDHARAKHGIRSLCQQCGKGFKTKNAIRHHIRDAPEHGVDCPYCQKKFPKASRLCGHLESGKCEGKGEIANRHLHYRGLYQFIRLKDPFENFTKDFLNWGDENLTGKARLFFYHCPNRTCKRQFRTLEGAMDHLETGTCKFATLDDVFYKICPDIIDIHPFKFLGVYPSKGRK